MTVMEMAQAHRVEMQQLSLEASSELTGMWRTVDRNNIRDSWTRQVPRAAALVGTMQMAAAVASERYTRNILEEQNISPQGPRLNPQGFAGTTYPLGNSSPVPLEVAVAGPAFVSLRYIGAGHDVERAMAGGYANMIAKTQTAIADAARQSEGVTSTTVEAPVRQVRIVQPGACDRCIILAGRTYRDASFLRHPGCACSGMPTDEQNADKYTTDPYEHFNGLEEAEQDAKFGRANAQAVRDGGDIFQVVNARREMYTSEGGALATRAGTTRRGNFGRQEQRAGRTRDRRGRERYGVATRERLMPEAIYKQAAGDRALQLSMLEEYGFILPQGQVPAGAIRGFNERSLARPEFSLRDGVWQDLVN